jgi:Uma2 family endonuclease
MLHSAINHNIIESNLVSIFSDYLNDSAERKLYTNLKVQLSDEDSFRPDILLVLDESKVISDVLHGKPDLVIGIILPWTHFDIRGPEFRLCQKYGIKEYWVITPGSNMIDVYRHSGQPDSIYDLFNVFSIWPDFMLTQMSDEEKAERVLTEFKTSLFDDLIIKVEDVFRNTIDEDIWSISKYPPKLEQ